MPTYAGLVDVEDREFQNVQELASLWGEIRTELERFDVRIEESYAVLGEYDFIVVFEAPDRDSAVQAALTIQGYGLDMQTMEATDTDHFADLVGDR
ncbi:GYD domain-containing protein [Halalkalicoccus tibetensis]|uniref:GYD domain-containing protein n=1 Tax=Halalkalicoccus tibetensis TaxID=175632 RepID=A0ABD5V063_9EURY